MATPESGSRPIARYKDLCIDTGRTQTLGRFWAAALGLELEASDDPADAGALAGPTKQHRIWMNDVPETKSVKHRVHLDVHCASVEDLVALGATVLQPPGRFPWVVLADPEGGEFCAFVREPDTLADYRLFEMVIDSVEPREIASWWSEVFGATLDGRPEKGWWWITDVPGLPFESWDFVPVPEPKTVKNRIHWDVLVDSVDDLVNHGATLLRGPTAQDDWSILADPEGNEFCAFVRHD